MSRKYWPAGIVVEYEIVPESTGEYIKPAKSGLKFTAPENE